MAYFDHIKIYYLTSILWGMAMLLEFFQVYFLPALPGFFGCSAGFLFLGGGMSMYVQNTTAEGLILGDDFPQVPQNTVIFHLILSHCSA